MNLPTRAGGDNLHGEVAGHIAGIQGHPLQDSLKYRADMYIRKVTLAVIKFTKLPYSTAMCNSN